MKVVVLSSSSAGNSAYVELNNTKFLIDAGIGFNDIKNKLSSIGVSADEIDFIIVTHAHSDHVRSIHSFNRVYNTKIYISKSTFDEYPKRDLIHNYEFIDDIDLINGIKVSKIPLSHDRSGYAYCFDFDNKSVCWVSDTGMINQKYHDLLRNKNVYLFESNHDVEMEMNGSKDEFTKIRNIGDTGHLSNEQCAVYLNKLIGEDTKAIVLVHISYHDNTESLAYNTNRCQIREDIPIYLAHEHELSDIIEI